MWSWIRIQSGLWIRIRVQVAWSVMTSFGLVDPNSEAGSGSRRSKMIHDNRNKIRNFKFWIAGCSLLGAKGFSGRLDVFSAVSFFQFLVIKALDLVLDPDPDWYSAKMPDPVSMTPDLLLVFLFLMSDTFLLQIAGNGRNRLLQFYPEMRPKLNSLEPDLDSKVSLQIWIHWY